jgi:PAS domain S-box-containing protein
MSQSATSGVTAPAFPFRCLLRPAFGLYAAVLVALIVLGIYVVLDSRERETQAAMNNAANLARVFSERLESTLQRIDGDLKAFIALMPPDALNPAASARYRQRIENEFRLNLDNFPEIASRTVVDANGQSLYRVGTPSPVKDFSDRKWFSDLRDNPQLSMVISDVITARASGKPTIVFARAIRDANGRLLGTANATLELETLDRLISSLNIGDRGSVSVRRTDINKLVMRSPPAPDQLNLPANGGNLARIRAGETSGTFVNRSVIDGIKRATAFRVINDYPFYVIVGIAEWNYLAQWRKTTWFTALAALALILAMTAFVVSRIRNESRLSLLAKRLKAGEAALRANETFLRDVIESASDGMLVEDRHGHTRAVNRRFELMWKIAPGTALKASREELHAQLAGQLVNAATLPVVAQLPQTAEVIRLRPIELIDGRRIETCASLLLHNGEVEGRVWSFHDVTESKRTLRLYRSIIESSADAFVAFDSELRITAWSARAEQIFGLSANGALGHKLPDTILPQADAGSSPVQNVMLALQSGNHAGARAVQRVRARRADGREFPAEIQISGFPMGERWQYTSFVRDISARLLEEEQVAQSQKFDAIGELTGGLAHDFNNLLGIIIGSLDLINEDFAGDRELLDAAMSAAQRGAEVTKSLLGVARHQQLSPHNVGIDALLHELAPLLRHTAGKTIDLTIDAQSGGAIVNIDAGGFNNALINLVINARDAMPDGGSLVISAAQDALTDAAANAARRVVIRVSDNGCGMAPAVAARAFDPFFTTKVRGKGTGLGLAMVYGFARQSGGSVTLSSTVGAGTTVELRLPTVAATAAPNAGVSALPLSPGRGERVLLVDDEADLLRVTQQWLSAAGYAVVAENDPARALALLEQSRFDALVSDVVMPGGIDGYALAAAAAQRQVAVLLVSGFTDKLPDSNCAQHRLLDKPFTKAQIQQALRAALDYNRTATTPPPQQAAA